MTQMLGAFVSVYKTDNPTFLTFLHIDRGKHLSDFYQNSLKKKKRYSFRSPRGNASICMAFNTVYSGTKEEYTGNREART